MNIDPSSIYHSGHRSVLENVGKCTFTVDGQTAMVPANHLQHIGVESDMSERTRIAVKTDSVTI